MRACALVYHRFCEARSRTQTVFSTGREIRILRSGSVHQNPDEISASHSPSRTTPYRRRSLSCELFESVIIRHLLTNAADCIFDGGAYQSRRLAFRDVGLVGKDADHDLVLAVDQ